MERNGNEIISSICISKNAADSANSKVLPCNYLLLCFSCFAYAKFLPHLLCGVNYRVQHLLCGFPRHNVNWHHKLFLAPFNLERLAKPLLRNLSNCLLLMERLEPWNVMCSLLLQKPHHFATFWGSIDYLFEMLF